MYDSRNRIIKTAPLIWRSILVNEDTCMLHLLPQEPLPLRSRYIEQRPCPTNFLLALKQRHWRIRGASGGVLKEAILSSFRKVSAVKSLLSKCRGEIWDAPPHKEVLRRRQATSPPG